MAIKLKQYLKNFINIFITLLSIIIIFIFFEFLLKYYGLGEPVIYRSSNYYGYYHKPNTKVKRFNNLISFDELGNRFSPEYKEYQDDNLVFVGDSVTYGGSSVSTEDLFSLKISKKLNKKYINISSNGWGIPNMINFIEFNNIPLNREFVFILIEDSFLRNLRRHEQNFFFVSEPGFSLNEFAHRILSFILEKSNFQDAKLTKELLNFNKRDNDKTMHYSLNKLIDFKKKVSLSNGKLIIIYSPNNNDFKYYISKNKKYLSEFKKNYFNILNKNQVKIVDLMNYISERDKHNFRYYYSDTVHLNKKGHLLYSEIISEILKEHEIF